MYCDNYYKAKAKLSRLSVLCLLAILLMAPAIASSDVDYSNGPPTRFIIKYKESATDGMVAALPYSVSQQFKAERMQLRAERLSSQGGENMRYVRQMALDKRAVFRAERQLSKDETQRMLTLLAQDDEVEWVEEDVLLQASFTPNDPQYNDQWHYYEATGGLETSP